MLSRKDTAWKKSRKFGDVKGGRMRPKFADRIFARAHSIGRPSANDELPIFMVDNPSRDYFFPITEEEIRRELTHLPQKDWRGITHFWLRRFKKSEYEAGELPLAEFSCGSGVRVVTLYPWPRNLEWHHGRSKPSASARRLFEKYNAELSNTDGSWKSSWKVSDLKNFYIEHLLFHEIGHHVDWYTRRWSSANARVLEDVADHYAFCKTTKRSIFYERGFKRPAQRVEVGLKS